jgi:membrane-associated protease RseP (regulator of RpoE activity)
LPLRIGTEELVADLDSGSMGALILPASVAKALPLARQPALTGQARTVAGAVDILSAPLNGDATIGSWTLRAPVLEFSDLFPKANVGSLVLREFTITIDQRNARVRLDRPSSDPITLAPPPRRAGVGGVPTPEGFRVELVAPGGAGAKAGLEVGDIITAIGGKPFASIPADAVGPALTSAARVDLQVRRGDRTMTLTLVY